MIEAYDKVGNVPIFTESFGLVAPNNTMAANATATMLSNLPTAHARRIDVLLEQTATGAGNGVQSVVLRSYTAGRKFYFDHQINAAFTAATHGVVVGAVYNAASENHVIGETCDILVTNGTQSNNVTVWAIART